MKINPSHPNLRYVLEVADRAEHNWVAKGLYVSREAAEERGRLIGRPFRVREIQP